MAATASTTSSSTLYRGLALHETLHEFDIDDEEVSNTFVFAGLAALNDALQVPANTFGDVRMKLAAIMSEVGEGGLVEVEDLALLARDLDVLLGGTRQ